MKMPLVGASVKLARPIPVTSPPRDKSFVPAELTPDHILIFMGEKDGKWHVICQGLPTPSSMLRSGFANAHFQIPTEYFEGTE